MISNDGSSSNAASEPSPDAQAKSDGAVPESYIREIGALLGDTELLVVEEELRLLSQLENTPDVPLGLVVRESLPPPLPTMHPILNPATRLQYPPVLPPPQCSIWTWFWLSITCAW